MNDAHAHADLVTQATKALSALVQARSAAAGAGVDFTDELSQILAEADMSIPVP